MEVYRGPQSTLQGRNAIGGVVAIKTADPTFDWQGKVRGVIGGDKTRQISGAVGGPVVADVLAFRLSADYRVEDVFVGFGPYEARKMGISEATSVITDPCEKRARNLSGQMLCTPPPELST